MKDNQMFIDADTHSGNTQDPYNSFENSIEYGTYANEVEFILKETKPHEYTLTKYPEGTKLNPVFDPFSFASQNGSTLILNRDGTHQILNFDYEKQFPTHIPTHDGKQNQDAGGLIPHNEESHAPAEFKVTFMSLGSVVREMMVLDGKSILEVPELDPRDGYELKGWGATEDASEVIDLTSVVITEDTTLYAIWTEVNVTSDVGAAEDLVSGDGSALD